MQKIILTIGAVFLLQACADVDRLKTEAQAEGPKLAQEHQSIQARKIANQAVVIYNGKILKGQLVKSKEDTSKLKQMLNEEVEYASYGQYLSELLDDISIQTGVPIVYPLRRQDDKRAEERGEEPLDFRVEKNIAHRGPLSKLLDKVAAEVGGFWRVEDEQIKFFKYITKTWQLSIPRNRKIISEGISLGGQNTAASVSVNSNSFTDPYENLRVTIESLIGIARPGAGTAAPQGAAPAATASTNAAGDSRAQRVSVSRDFGILSVTTTPDNLSKVDEVVKVINSKYLKNILVNVKVYSWTLNDAATVSVAINGTVGSSLGATAANVPSAGSTTSSVSLNTSNLSALFSYMKQYGEVSQITSGNVRAINGQPAPIQIVNDITYIASVTTTSVANAGTQTGVTPGSVRVGFTANFVPMIIEGDKIALDYSISLSSATIKTATSAGQTIGTPEISSQALQQSTVLNNGQSIVLMGFERQSFESADASGASLFGKAASKKKELLVLVMDVSHVE